MITRRHRETSETGAGVVTMGITAVLILLILLIATQTLVVLQRRSMVHAAAADIAERAASTADFSDTQADELARQILGDVRADATVETVDEFVVVTLRATSPSLLRGPLSTITGVDQTVRRRLETFRPS
jgi:Na+-transporting methylmalonyl-CoA/oxaloacetate decarboxylase gamma subunit